MLVFYSTNVNNNTLILTDEEHGHCTKVLRNQVGSSVMVTDGNGNLYACVIEKIYKSEIQCRINTKQTFARTSPGLAIAISPLKNPSRLEWFVEKAVEIGLSDIFIFMSARTEKKVVNGARLEKIMVSAMKQSLNLYLPSLTICPNFDALIDKTTHFGGKFVAYCEGSPPLLKNIADKNATNVVLIGPEGDFTPEEINTAIEKGFGVVSLGVSRLRTETAGLMALFMLKY
jgi:16S rRNA (uracil1498-N3)-methyltransferase